ncbi:cytochrome P450 monooxygenase-like protein [Cucurbitaria berberidis CBS 394.84]|uniref:Cytochrome P450 monooxygenase-like protein n=1 Tax=Cucurbitaria berberidis CBS 394.84 TaxID=1168544 RepID=A0A9P4GKW7_9PLEO|nr:cytochrome P450 monooxygenase-like protein [Cucurbitaria berberidis CBS 394.84]KAF1848218.1 cytochrome P450 monooxygenase-like protein [Cucurbitaria berberidis CBS 394.84]
MTLSTNVLPDWIPLFSLTGIASSFGSLFSLAVLYVLATLIYNVFFHPLKHIPGPLFARACGIPYAVRMRNGNIIPWIREQHERYGDAVRLAPSEVSFISGETAWPDIYGFRTGKKYKNTGAYSKDRSWFPTPVNKVWSLLGANEEDHSRMRRNVSHAFSDKSLRQQETLVQSYVDLLVHRLGENAAEGKDVDIMRWYNCTTFDVIADLSFGEPLYCLRDNQYHNWVNMILASNKAGAYIAIRNKYPLFKYYDIVKGTFKDTKGSERARIEFYRLTHDKVESRLEKGAEGRPDFFSFIIKNQETESKALTRKEMDTNALGFLIAGSETTATALSGTTYLLLKNPAAYAKLVHEIRSTFTSHAEITIEEVNKLEYMIACLQEGLRYYPPVPSGFPRVVPPGGDHISGHYIPGGTSVYVSQHASNRSTRNFKDPDAYVPERWVGDERYKDDNHDSMNPFSFGPRNCLGKSLAYAEMRLILAKVLFNFDLEIVNDSQDWMKEQKTYALWEKPSLMVKLKSVQR